MRKLALAGLLGVALAFLVPEAGKTQTTQCIASAAAQGTSDAITIAALPCALTTNLLILSTTASNTTTTPTLQPLGLPAQTIVRANGIPLAVGDIVANGKALLNPTGTQWVLLNPANVSTSVGSISGLGANVTAALAQGLNGASGLVGVTNPTLAGANLNYTTPQAYGALANSNGTHGNGYDDTSAIQSALTASANGTMFLPCGTYRITAPLTVTDAAPRNVIGAGACTKIFSDQSSAGATFSFVPATGACGAGENAACGTVSHLQFLAPHTYSAGQIAIYYNNTNGPLVEDVDFVGQYQGISYVASYKPMVLFSRFFGGFNHIVSTDISFNAGELLGNEFYLSSDVSVIIAPSSGCAVNVSIRNGDSEGNATAFKLGNICAGTFSENYVECTSAQAVFNFVGSAGPVAMRFEGNNLSPAVTGGTGNIVLQNLNNAVWQGNSLYGVNFSYGSHVSQVRLRAIENTSSGTSFPATTVSGSGAGASAAYALTGDDFFGYVTMTAGGAGITSAGSITLTFTNPMAPNHAVCLAQALNGTGIWTTPVSLVLNSGGTGSTVIQWTNASTNLTSGSYYGISYQCGPAS